MLDNRQVQMTCAKSAGVSLGDRIKSGSFHNGNGFVSEAVVLSLIRFYASRDGVYFPGAAFVPQNVPGKNRC